MKRSCSILLAAVAFAAFTTTAQAQDAKFGIEAAGLYATLSGDDFEGTDAGMGFDAQLRYAFSPKFSLGGGVQRTTHSIDGFSEDLGVWGFFAEPRYHFAMSGSNMMPYLTGRVAYMSESIDEAGTEASATGFLFGFGGGLGFQVSPTISLGGSVTYNLVNFGDAEVDGTTVDGTDASGSSLAVRFGVSFTFK